MSGQPYLLGSEFRSRHYDGLLSIDGGYSNVRAYDRVQQRAAYQRATANHERLLDSR